MPRSAFRLRRLAQTGSLTALSLWYRAHLLDLVVMLVVGGAVDRSCFSSMCDFVAGAALWWSSLACSDFTAGAVNRELWTYARFWTKYHSKAFLRYLKLVCGSAYVAKRTRRAVQCDEVQVLWQAQHFDCQAKILRQVLHVLCV